MFETQHVAELVGERVVIAYGGHRKAAFCTERIDVMGEKSFASPAIVVAVLVFTSASVVRNENGQMPFSFRNRHVVEVIFHELCPLRIGIESQVCKVLARLVSYSPDFVRNLKCRPTSEYLLGDLHPLCNLRLNSRLRPIH